MALTLDDVMKIPDQPTLDHLTALGIVKPPQPEQPLVPPATLSNRMTPATVPQPVSSMKPMTAASPHLYSNAESFAKDYQPGTGLGDVLRKEDRFLNAENVGHTVPAMTPATATAAPDMGLSPTPEASSVFGGGGASAPNLNFKQQMALPKISDAVHPGSSQFYENELQREEAAKAHPWGSEENHPGLLGKIGHVLGRVGNTALDVFAPATAALIPGTDLNKRVEEARTQRNLGEAQTRESQEAERAENVKNTESEIREREGKNTQELVQDAQGNVTGWKDKHGLHALEDADTPQSIKDIAADAQNKLQKPTFQEDKQGNIVALKTDKDGKTSSEVVYHATPGQKLEVKQIVGADGHAHDLVFDMNQKNPDGSVGVQVGNLGRSKEDKAPSVTSELAKVKAGEQLVRGFDKNGVERMMPKAQADEEGLSHVSKATDKEWDDAKQNTAALNDMGAKVKNLIESSKALDQGTYQSTLIQQALKGHPDDYSTRFAISLMSDMSKQYVQDVFSLREAALALPKQTTGGSRVSEPQAQALWNTIPGSSGNSQYGISQLKKFDENLARLWKKVPQIEGQTQERPFGHETGQKEEAPEPPKGKTTVYDTQGVPHFVLSNKVDDFLKDPKYKGWSKNAPTAK